MIVQAGTTAGMIKFNAKATGLWSGGTDIQTITTESVSQVSADSKYKLTIEQVKPREVGKMLGADISFLPELEARGMKFSDNGVEKMQYKY